MARPRLLTVDIVAAVARKPSMWPEALRMLRVMRPVRPAAGQNRQALLPSAEYLAFRLHTNTGSDDPPSGHDVVRYLKWTGSQRRVLG